MKTFRERELECVVQEKALANERKALEDELKSMKVQLAEEIMDVVAYKTTLQAGIVCAHHRTRASTRLCLSR